MTDEQLKVLAELLIVNDSRLTVLSDILNGMLEREIDRGDADAPNANSVRHHIEQLAALSRDSESARKQAREYFGLPPES